jgi:Domain of unknown function (DUF6602)
VNKWSLPNVLAELHDDIERRLEAARKCLSHSVTKGDACEDEWLKLFQDYLPQRYEAAKAHVVDSKGTFSDQIDVVIFDRQYSPFIFKFGKQKIIPAESVYAVFESKQTINATQVSYAKKKIASARRLHRTSLPIPHAGGTYAPKPLIDILGGLLTFESDWSPALGKPLRDALQDKDPSRHLNLGCVAAHGYYCLNRDTGTYEISEGGKPATAFLFKLISLLQFSGTVPMIDIQAYAQWLSK